MKIDETLFENIRNGSDWAMAAVNTMPPEKRVTQVQINRLWEAVIEAVLEGHEKALKLGLKINEMAQEPMGCDRYMNVLLLAGRPGSKNTYGPTIRTGAAVVLVQAGNIETPGFDKDKFLNLAKRALINVVRNGDSAARPFAVEALRVFEDREGIKEELLAIAGTNKDPKVMKVIVESLMELDLEGQLELVRKERKLLTGTVYQNDSLPGKLYIEMIFDAVEKVLVEIRNPEKRDGVMIAITQLAKSGISGDDGNEMLDDASLRIVQKNAEDALLYAVIRGDTEQKEIAMEGLLSIGSQRIMPALKSTLERDEATGTLSIPGRRILKRMKRVPPPIPQKALQQRAGPRVR